MKGPRTYLNVLHTARTHGSLCSTPEKSRNTDRWDGVHLLCFFPFLSCFGAIRNPPAQNYSCLKNKKIKKQNKTHKCCRKLCEWVQSHRSEDWTAASRSHVDKRRNCTSASRTTAFQTEFNSPQTQRQVEHLWCASRACLIVKEEKKKKRKYRNHAKPQEGRKCVF